MSSLGVEVWSKVIDGGSCKKSHGLPWAEKKREGLCDNTRVLKG